MLDPREVARALGGDVTGPNILVPGPDHSRADRSLSILTDPDARGGFIVHSFAGANPIACRDYVKAALGLSTRPRQVRTPKPSRARQRTPARSSAENTPYALGIFEEAGSIVMLVGGAARAGSG